MEPSVSRMLPVLQMSQRKMSPRKSPRSLLRSRGPRSVWESRTPWNPTCRPEDPAEDSETAAEEPVAESAVYVSKDGSDDGDGTKETPYATLAKAVDAALDGDTIYLLSNWRSAAWHSSIKRPSLLTDKAIQ